MALGVVGAMDEEAANRGGQSFSADGARLIEIGGGESTDTTDRVVNSLPEFGEHVGVGRAGVKFGLQRGKLPGAELFAISVGEQAIEAACDVAKMEGDGSEARGAGVEIIVVEGSAPGFDVLASEFERVDDGAEDRGEIGVGAAKPGFDHQGQGTGCTGSREQAIGEPLQRGREAGRGFS